VDEVSHPLIDERERIIGVRTASTTFHARPRSDRSERANDHQCRSITFHQELGLQTIIRKKHASIRPMYTANTFPKSALVHDEPSPSTSVL
jgi:hypothetical protein